MDELNGIDNDIVHVPHISADCTVSAIPNSDYSAGGKEETHGTTFPVTCDDGYSNGVSRVTQVTCNNGTLTPSSVTCYGKNYIQYVLDQNKIEESKFYSHQFIS